MPTVTYFRSPKVLVPAIYKEFGDELPSWITNATPDTGMTAYLYQRLEPNVCGERRNSGVSFFLRFPAIE